MFDAPYLQNICLPILYDDSFFLYMGLIDRDQQDMDVDFLHIQNNTSHINTYNKSMSLQLGLD